MIYRACFCKKQSLLRCVRALHGALNRAFTVSSETHNSDSDYLVPPRRGLTLFSAPA
jgi:hypothetical protein